jgi:hypothetical protein
MRAVLAIIFVRHGEAIVTKVLQPLSCHREKLGHQMVVGNVLSSMVARRSLGKGDEELLVAGKNPHSIAGSGVRLVHEQSGASSNGTHNRRFGRGRELAPRRPLLALAESL